MKYFCKCERCGSENALVDTSVQLSSFPPQYKYLCQDCDYSGTTSSVRFTVDFEEIKVPSKKVNSCYICKGDCKDDKEHICEYCKTAILYLRANLDKLK